MAVRLDIELNTAQKAAMAAIPGRGMVYSLRVQECQVADPPVHEF